MAKKKKAPDNPNIKLIATNPNARKNFLIEDSLEAGIVLQGTEVKSLRKQSPNLKDSYVEIKPLTKKSHDNDSAKDTFEGWLLNCHIAPYEHGNIWNHDPMRKRKLLLHKGQIAKLFGAAIKKGKSIIPVKMYFNKGIAKVQIGIGTGKKKQDRREEVKRRQAQREMDRAIKR